MQLVRSLLDKNWVEKHQRQLLLIVLAVGVAVIARNVVAHLHTDAFSHTDGSWAIAQNLVSGKGYSVCDSSYFPLCGPDNQTTAMRQPVPVLLMAAALLVWPSHISGVVLQGLMYLGTLLIIYATLKDFDPRTALLAAFLWVISDPAIRGIDTDAADMASAFFFAAGLLYFQKGRQKGRFSVWLLAGVFLGLAALSRAIFLGVAIALFIGLLWESRERFHEGLLPFATPALLCLVGFAAVLAPWAIRNEMALGTTEVGGTLTGYNLYRMNYILQNDPFVPHYVGPDEAEAAIKSLIQNSTLKGNENEPQMQAFYFEASLKIIRSHPIRYVLLSLYRFLPLWFDISVPEAYGGRFGLKHIVAMVEQALLLIAATAGALLYRRRFWPFTLSVVLASGAYMAVNGQLRYLADVMPAIVIPAASTVLLVDGWLHRTEGTWAKDAEMSAPGGAL